MNSRERVFTTLAHEEPDRAPIVIGSSNTTTIKMKAYRRLKQHLGLQAEERYLYDWPELGSAVLDEAVLQRLGSDVRGVWDRLPAAVLERNRKRPPHSAYIDDWGSGSIESEPGM